MAGHGKNPGYIPGDHWVVCDRCGLEYRESQMRRTWDNLIVCPKDYERRHPQDFVRAQKDQIAAQGLVRPPQDDRFITPSCTTRSAEAGEAIAGCAIAGFKPANIPDATF